MQFRRPRTGRAGIDRPSSGVRRRMGCAQRSSSRSGEGNFRPRDRGGARLRSASPGSCGELDEALLRMSVGGNRRVVDAVGFDSGALGRGGEAGVDDAGRDAAVPGTDVQCTLRPIWPRPWRCFHAEAAGCSRRLRGGEPRWTVPAASWQPGQSRGNFRAQSRARQSTGVAFRVAFIM